MMHRHRILYQRCHDFHLELKEGGNRAPRRAATLVLGPPSGKMLFFPPRPKSTAPIRNVGWRRSTTRNPDVNGKSPGPCAGNPKAGPIHLGAGPWKLRISEVTLPHTKLPFLSLLPPYPPPTPSPRPHPHSIRLSSPVVVVKRQDVT